VVCFIQFALISDSLGKGYTGIMADVLDYVADNPEILSRVSGATIAQ
jgi:hypothetical protein